MAASARGTIAIITLIICSLFSAMASAHYLWLGVDAKKGDHGTVNLFFEEGPAAGDGKYLDPFIERGTTWVRTIDNLEPQPLKTVETKKPGKRWLAAAIPADAPRSLDSRCQWGVYRYGNLDILLHYYARRLETNNAGQLKQLARAKQMRLDIVALDDQGTFQVLWEGKPAANRPMYIRGPQRYRLNTKTDKKGVVTLSAKHKGRYLLRSFVELNEAGKFEGKAFQRIRHHATLSIDLAAKK